MEENPGDNNDIIENEQRPQVQNPSLPGEEEGASQYEVMIIVENIADALNAEHEVILNEQGVEQVDENLPPPQIPPAPQIISSPAEESSARKRKSRRSASRTPQKLNSVIDDENDDGSICPICLDNWEMSGPHRLTSLKCGHLFGHSCIRRWMQENHHLTRCCPSCKTRATLRDFRFIYAKRICAVDNSEEHRLRGLLDAERQKNSSLQSDIGVLRLELAIAKTQVVKLESDINLMRKTGGQYGEGNNLADDKQQTNYRLFMEKNIEISKEAGCRVMTYGRNTKNLIVSQKSTQSLFPGFGVRFIDINTFRPTNFLHMSPKSVRDLCFNSSEDMLVSASMEKSAKLFNVYDRTVVSVFTPSDKPLWSCALDIDTNNFLYLGSQHGSTYVYDVRYPTTVVEEFKTDVDHSPVINICPVPPSDAVPFGGFLVCKLQTIWFYEYLASQEVVATKLNIEGPFTSMSYESTLNSVLISSRPNVKHCQSRYFIAHIVKIDNITTLDITETFFGGKVHQVMSRCTQICAKNDDSLLAAYLQDTKLLTMWNINTGKKLQSLSVSDRVLDTCPIYDGENTYLSALTDTKCRIYKIISE